MNQTDYSAIEKSVLDAVSTEHLTSFEILKKVEEVPMLLSLYNVIDKLRSKGAVDSYVKEDIKYHYAV